MDNFKTEETEKEILDNTEKELLKDEVNIELEVMKKNVSSHSAKLPHDTKFRKIRGFFKKMLREALLAQESFNASVYRALKTISQRSSNAKIVELEEKIEKLQESQQAMQEEINSLKKKD